MVKRFLKAGVSEDGTVTVSDKGTPQGGGHFTAFGQHLPLLSPLRWTREYPASSAQTFPGSSAMPPIVCHERTKGGVSGKCGAARGNFLLLPSVLFGNMGFKKDAPNLTFRKVT